MSELIVLYGTLMSGLPARPGAPDLSSHLRLVSACVVEGVLYDAGAYPGLVPGGDRVSAELWRCVSPKALEILDEWENYHPDRPGQSEYVRRPISLLEPGGQAWVYHWNLPTDTLRPIEGGDWRAHIRDKAQP